MEMSKLTSCLVQAALCLSLLTSVVLGSVSTENLFNYGIEAGDSRLPNGDDTFINVTLTPSEGFRYFNSSYPDLFVNVNGAISFRQGVSQFTPTCGPLSLPMIVPFWSDVNTNLNGTVFYRESSNRDLLRKASADVVKAFPQFGSISLGWIFIATWDEVAFFGAIDACNGRSLRNTFQVILTTDGTHSFVIFYYNKINWTTGIASGGNCTGLGGTPAKAGFDVGDNATFYTIPGSCSSEIINVASTSNINEPGKWVFRIDEEFESVSCENYNESTRLSISPSFVPLLGHVPITVRGPCLENALNASCEFYDIVKGIQPTVVEGKITSDRSAVICEVPYLYSYERMKVEVKLTLVNSSTAVYSGYVYTTNPVDDELIINISDDFSTLNLTWDPLTIPSSPNGTMNFPLKLTLVEMNGSVWTERGILAEGFQNTGSYNGSIAVASQTLFRDLGAHFVTKLTPIQATKTSEYGTSSLFSAPNFLRQPQPNGFFTSLCNSWYEADSGPPTDVLPCPPLLEQALVDQRFEQDKSPSLDYYHHGADYSFRQRVPSSSGAGQQCVYKDGRILIGPPGGGTADFSSPTSISGFLSHLSSDVYPWFACCKYSNDDESCRKYYEKRPSDAGNDYLPPNPGNGNGDPHITTFDGLSYMFNGVGEFWMIRSSTGSAGSFEMQARMEQFITVEGTPMNASIFTAFVIKETRPSSTAVVQVSVGPSGLQVLLDGDAIDVPIVAGEGQGSTTLSNNGVSLIISSSKLSLSFKSGFSFDLSIADNIALNIIGSAGPEFNGRINGLLGRFDGNLDNDLTTPDGIVISRDSTLQEIHNNFGLKWMTTEAESLFVYPPGKNYASFYNPTFQPSFVIPDISTIPEEIVTLCGGVMDCLFDFVTTGSRSLANSTREISLAINETREVISKPVEMCQPPLSLENGFIEASNYFLGSTVSFKCNEAYELKGKTTLTCEKRGDSFLWNGDAPSCRKKSGSNANRDTLSSKGFLLLAIFRLFCNK